MGRPLGFRCLGGSGWALTPTPGGLVPKRSTQHTLEHGGGTSQGTGGKGPWLMGRPPPPAPRCPPLSDLETVVKAWEEGTGYRPREADSQAELLNRVSP